MNRVGWGLIFGFAAGCTPQWHATFPVAHQDVSLTSVGSYRGGEVELWLDTTAANAVGPNESGQWKVVPDTAAPAAGKLIFTDKVPALKMQRGNKAEPYVVRDGAICAMATVNQVFTDVRVSATVNTEGGWDGGGSKSRQGPLLRWRDNKFLSCFVDFALGTAYFFSASNIYQYQARGSVKIKGFDNKKSYRVQAEMTGNTGRCQVFDGATMVADTGPVQHPEVSPDGLTGVMFEVSLADPELPLEGSATLLSAVALEGS